MVSKSVSFYPSEDIDVQLQVKIISLQGRKRLLKASEKLINPQLGLTLSNISPASDMLVSVQVFDSRTMEDLTIPVFSKYIPFRHSRVWDQWLTLPIRIKHLTPTCKLNIILWEYDGDKRVPFTTLSVPIFNDRDYTLKRGIEAIKFDKNGDQSTESMEIVDTINKFLCGEYKKVDWLDGEILRKLYKQFETVELPINTFIFNIQFPIMDLPVVYTEKLYEDIQRNIPTLYNFDNNFSVDHSISNNNGNSVVDPKLKISMGTKYNSTLKFYDPDQFNNDPVEEKFRRLERASKHSKFDKQLKPDTKKREYLNRIIAYPPGTKLTAHEKGSIWKYRYFLQSNKKALMKLLQSTNFKEETERTEVLEMMDGWAEIDIDDAIGLLGHSYRDLSVRTYAVNRLKKASDKELELYLLQLVQAVCFEYLYTFTDAMNSDFGVIDWSSGSHLTNSSHKINPNDQNLNSIIHRHHTNSEAKLPISQTFLSSIHSHSDSQMIETPIVISPLAEFLIRRALVNKRLGNYFYWYVKSESYDQPFLNQILESFLSRIAKNDEKTLQNQMNFVSLLRHCCEEIKALKDTVAKKRELLQHLLSGKVKSMLKQSAVILPLDPDIILKDVVVEESKVFKSSLSPLMITFLTSNNEKYSLMFKVGDDLRQDQLVVQIISLMNELLKNENVDLKLIPYKILATGPDEGAIQFIPNDTMANILSQYHGILPFFRAHHPDKNNELGVKQWVMDNFVKSCAGYCVITYILGVGDRHLDNLLITHDGMFFHADFGYILGQDPKPFPPLMKLPPQIIEAFGGAESSNYNKFRSYCFVAYSILRRNAGLILNLFELMKTSNIPDIRVDSEGSVLKVKERFNLDLTEEEATIHFQTLINDSVNALLPIVIDHLHNLAQYWRA
ncbi:phosphatidylinositol 3-kinase VPS34 [Nakaseomyces bracarensis]|uniref:phosphatidylinositol 3-kinase VPS34 n=1 Tax=Nakaseomyces bracarensis TaxID=273131 RepID=UPI003871D4C8